MTLEQALVKAKSCPVNTEFYRASNGHWTTGNLERRSRYKQPIRSPIYRRNDFLKRFS